MIHFKSQYIDLQGYLIFALPEMIVLFSCNEICFDCFHCRSAALSLALLSHTHDLSENLAKYKSLWVLPCQKQHMRVCPKCMCECLCVCVFVCSTC